MHPLLVEPAWRATARRGPRPAFIRENYPSDRAFGFGAGDLLGVYRVFVPAHAAEAAAGDAS
ncbi:hypothetical protein AWN76_014250 [Rhodothermaceae bacterium RA]|nr:hypothetical protein AWN76_014250 [Rhodothermaceae bacterium RA]